MSENPLYNKLEDTMWLFIGCVVTLLLGIVGVVAGLVMLYKEKPLWPAPLVVGTAAIIVAMVILHCGSSQPEKELKL